MNVFALPAELQVLACSVVLLLAHISAQGMSSTAELGTAHNLSPRDDDRKASGVLAGRLRRASANYQETFPAFAALALALAVAHRTGGLGASGAWLWLACRILYLPLYAFGVPVFRSLAWTGSVIGLLLMLARLAI
jgi:uncharacterized MAPEG superfamily protein